MSINDDGEDLPKGASLLGRLLIVELKKGDVDLSYLNSLQDQARKGEFSACMAAFLRWLAPRMKDLKQTFPSTVRDYRDKAQKEKFASSHSRAADIYASLYAAAELYIDFALDTGAIGKIKAEEHRNTINAALKELIRAQSQYQKQADEVERFIALLRACFGAGECHVGNHLNQGPPVQKEFLWGWRKPSQDADMAGCGQLIGWLNETNGELWLQPEAAFKVAQRFAMAQNDPLLMQKATLWKRLLERGLLADFDTDKHGRKRTDIKRTVAGGRPRVLVFPTSIIESEWGADDD